MRLGVLGVGSHTVRLLVARVAAPAIVPLCREQANLSLGEDLVRNGAIGADRLELLATQVAEFAGLARDMRVDRLDALLTSPGREANNARLVATAVSQAAAARATTLSLEELAEAAFEGALAENADAPDPVAVCDVGATATVVAIGTREGGPAYVRSIPLGSLSLRAELGSGMPSGRAIAAARQVLDGACARLIVPLPKAALVTGGAPRALRNLVGRSIDLDAVEAALRIARRCPAAEIVRIHGLPAHRAETLAADALILRELHRRLAVPLQVSDAGHREGFAARLATRLSAAA